MKVTYIYHSSFAVELEKSMLIFVIMEKGTCQGQSCRESRSIF